MEGGRDDEGARVRGSRRPRKARGAFASGPLLIRDAALFTDLYELTMAASHLREGMRGPATFSVFARQLPRGRAFLVAAGLEDVLNFLREFRFSEDALSEPAMFMAHLAQIATWVDEHPDRLVLLGAHATSPEVEYGWIEPGEPLESTGDRRVWEVRRFWEKPSAETARVCLEAGCLWNTFVLVGKAATFLRAGREAVPEVESRLTSAEPFFGTDEEAWALHQAYALMPKANFSRSVLEPCPRFLAVAAIPQVVWSDLGTPRRVFEILERVQDRPAWFPASDLVAS